MKKIKYPKLIKIALILINILLFLFIIKECKLVGFCCTILMLISPIFFGYSIAWLLKPCMKKLNKYFNTYISTSLTYIILSLIMIVLGYYFIPVIVKEIKHLIPNIVHFYNNLPPKIINSININEISNKALKIINDFTNSMKNILINTFYSFFISFYFLTNHKTVSKFLSKYLAPKITNDISTNLRLFVKGTLLDTLILFIMTIISFFLVKMPYAFLFSVIISLTNIIPFIGPYIGGIPAILVGLSYNYKLGIIILIIVVLLQFIESYFIHPFIMSKSLKLNPITIIMGLIIFGYFFGIFGLLISTPLLSIFKTLFLYYKKQGFKFKQVLDK